MAVTQNVSRVLNRIRNIVDSPGGNPENEPELATATVESTGERDATYIPASVSGWNCPQQFLKCYVKILAFSQAKVSP